MGECTDCGKKLPTWSNLSRCDKCINEYLRRILSEFSGILYPMPPLTYCPHCGKELEAQ